MIIQNTEFIVQSYKTIVNMKYTYKIPISVHIIS